MKKIILILLLLGGLVVGGSYQVGKIIEAELPGILERAGQLGQVKITITSYERKLFRSSVTSEVTLASISGGLEQVHLVHEIWHGPFPFGKSEKGTWHYTPLSALVETSINRDNPPTGLIGLAFELCPELYEASETTRFDFAGNGSSTFSIPGFEKSFDTDAGAIMLNWQGLSGTAVVDNSMKQMEGEISIPSVRIGDGKSELQISDVSSRYRVFEDFGGLLLGSVSVDTALIEHIAGADKTSLKELQFRNDARLNGTDVSYSIAIGANALQIAEDTYGPAGFEIDFLNLDAATILEVQKKLQTIQAEIKSLSDEEIGSRVLEIYAEAMPELLKKSPEIRLNYLNLTGPNGEFWCKGNVLFENRPMRDLGDFLAAMKVRGESQASKALLHAILSDVIRSQLTPARENGQLGELSDGQFTTLTETAAAEQLAQMEAAGTILPVGDDYKVDFTFENSRALLNGNPLR